MTLASIEIPTGESGDALGVPLGALLRALGPEALAFNWYLYEFEAVGAEGFDVLEFEREARGNPSGFAISYQALEQLAARTVQTINAIIAGGPRGCESTQGIVLVPPIGEAFYLSFAVVLECIDGEVWRVTCTSPEVLAKLKRSFRTSPVPVVVERTRGAGASS